jgi:hypothetical protein
MPVKTIRLSDRKNARDGFTMVLIAALFVSFAVVAAVAIERNTVLEHISRRDKTIDQLTRLSNALIEYSVFNNNVYPCPAGLNVAANNAAFGMEAIGCSTARQSGVADLGSNVHMGFVPVLTLSGYGVSINDAFDPWNNRIMYVVNRTLTLTGTPNRGNNPTLINPATGVAMDTRTGATLIRPDFILISYGRDGIGATKRNVASIDPPPTCAAGANTVLRLENCNNNGNFVQTPTNASSNTTQATYYDDILTYYRR